MTKLLRTLLTAAVLAAIGVRLRRRARRVKAEAGGGAATAQPERRRPLWGAVLAVLAATAVTLAVAVVPLVPRASLGQSAVRMRPPVAAPATAQSAPSPSVTPTPAECVRQAAPVVRPLNPRVVRAVNRQWRRIERWLAENAPVTRATLARPARARTIAIAEAQMNLRFPDDLRASLLRHDGGLPTPLNVRGMRDRWRAQCVSWGEEELRYRDLIPVGILDVVHAETGRMGVVGRISGPAFEDGRPSYYALLRDMADALERGRPLDDQRPVVRSGELEWVPLP
ncbi:hypothetical protein ACIBG7_09185 [Nonomuraea sp. NPDC050328]|uniref:hypothetical protein n=1 Tax=Nonomuraea sp. NPDC050328 TaxID=3364361 RepID=UPI0037AA88D4